MAAKKVKANDLYISTFTFNFHFFIQLPPDLQPSHISDRFFLCLPCFFQIILIFLPFFVFSYFAHAPISVMLCPKHLTLHFYFFIFAPVPISPMFCPQRLPLPLPLPFVLKYKGKIGGKVKGKHFGGKNMGEMGARAKKRAK